MYSNTNQYLIEAAQFKVAERLAAEAAFNFSFSTSYLKL